MDGTMKYHCGRLRSLIPGEAVCHEHGRKASGCEDDMRNAQKRKQENRNRQHRITKPSAHVCICNQRRIFFYFIFCARRACWWQLSPRQNVLVSRYISKEALKIKSLLVGVLQNFMFVNLPS